LLCCVGDLVEDVVVWLPSDIATGTDTNASIRRRRGGSAANVAVSAAATGVPVRFIGRVGADAIGAALVTELLGAGVDARVQREGRTGTIVVLVDTDGERSMLPDRAAATELEDIDDAALDGVTWLHAPAYSLVIEPLATTTVKAIRAVQQVGGTVSIDASSVAIINEVGASRFNEMLADLGPDVVLCNQDEGVVLGVAARQGVAGVELTVVKSGADDVVAYRGGEIVAAVLPPHRSDVRDTTGAGDAFAAGFILARMDSDDIATAIGRGNQSAAQLLGQHSA
jgi:sugar/nucleoside kinase (ribokinase family)